MQLGMIGLGRMGANMTKRLEERGHEMKTYDPQVDSTAKTLEELRDELTAPRTFWMMVPSGDITEQTFQTLISLAEPGDVIVDGGNSNFHDSQRRYAAAKEHGVKFVDAGVSGGVWGYANGYCLMVGGDDDAIAQVEPVFRDLAPEDGYAHVGASGAGHFTKMVHNGIEYGLMQAYAESFEVMKASEFDLNLHEIAGIWRYGSVVRSWLLELLHAALDGRILVEARLLRTRGERTGHEDVVHHGGHPIVAGAELDPPRLGDAQHVAFEIGGVDDDGAVDDEGCIGGDRGTRRAERTCGEDERREPAEDSIHGGGSRRKDARAGARGIEKSSR